MVMLLSNTTIKTKVPSSVFSLFYICDIFLSAFSVLSILLNPVCRAITSSKSVPF